MELTHPLVDIRQHQHNGETDWLSVAQEAIVQVLRRQGTVHANDLYELGLPDEACNVAGSAFASYIGKGWIVSTEKRLASTRPSRNCAKSFIYRATSKFPRPATAGVGADWRGASTASRSLPVGIHSGGAGVGAGIGTEESHSRARASVNPGESSPGDRQDKAASGSSVGLSATPGEQVVLQFELPPERPAHDHIGEAA